MTITMGETVGKVLETAKPKRRKLTLEEKEAQYQAGLASLDNRRAKETKRRVQDAIKLLQVASGFAKGKPYKDGLDKAHAMLLAVDAQIKVTAVQ